MNDHGAEALARLREIRDALGEDNAPRRINLRDYAEPGSSAWDAFVEVSGTPGHKVRRPTMLARINQAIDALTARLLGNEPPLPPATSPDPPPARPTSEPLATASDLARIVGETPGGPRPVERVRLRWLTPDGIAFARDFLRELREKVNGEGEPPRQLLYDERYAQRFPGDIEVERRSFRTRREAAEYLAPRLRPVRHLVMDHVGLWSWLGMFYFKETVSEGHGTVRLSNVDETLVIDPRDSRSVQRRYRHYLWSAWRLYEQHGERAAFLLDRRLTAGGEIANQTLGLGRIFNSIGVVPLVLHLYTSGGHQKRGFQNRRGGIRHLIRVLDQLERTYDIYGMEPDAILRILPDEFRAWDSGPGPDQ